VLRAARRGDDGGRPPARALPRGDDAARRPDDARDGEAPARRARPPGRTAGSRHEPGRHDDPRDPRAGARRRPGRVPERGPGCDGALEGAGGGRLIDVELVVLDDADAATEAAAQRIAEAVDAGGHVGLSGGSGPRRAYERVAILRPNWSGVDLWWIDDRVVPPADGNSNYRLIRESLLDGLARRPAVHRIH